MKMIMVIVARDEAERVLQGLVAADHTATYVETRGGMLRQAQITLFVAVEAQHLEAVLSIVEQACCSEPVVETAAADLAFGPMPAKPRLGGAVVFVWNIERSETY
jgi:uncharacterized protein YaaQ